MYLLQAEEVKAQSQEIRPLLARVQEQQKAIQKLLALASPQNPPRTPKAATSSSESRLGEDFQPNPGDCEYQVRHCSGLTFNNYGHSHNK